MMKCAEVRGTGALGRGMYKRVIFSAKPTSLIKP
jgi:hypothetical protein